MSIPKILLGDEHTTISFFYLNLRRRFMSAIFNEAEGVYVASVLAECARTPQFEAGLELEPITGLSGLYHNFVLKEENLFKLELLKIAGAKSLVFGGFFRGRMTRHNLDYYDALGSSFYYRAGALAVDKEEKELYKGLSRNFPVWTLATWELSQIFH